MLQERCYCLCSFQRTVQDRGCTRLTPKKSRLTKYHGCRSSVSTFCSSVYIVSSMGASRATLAHGRMTGEQKKKWQFLQQHYGCSCSICSTCIAQWCVARCLLGRFGRTRNQAPVSPSVRVTVNGFVNPTGYSNSDPLPVRTAPS